MAIKLNSSDNYESIMVILNEKNMPIAFNNKLQELLETGAFNNKEEAKQWIENTPIELELYYEKGAGLFGIEAEAVESLCDIYSPYNGELCESNEY